MIGKPTAFGIFLLATASSVLNAKEEVTEISIGAIRTELEREAVGYAIKHRPTNDIYLANSSGFTDATPVIEILTGGEDSFDGLIAKLQGHRSFLPQNFYASEGNTGSCSECAFHVVPFAIGIETDRNLENIALLGEVGYFPVGNARNGKPRYGLSGPRLGLFLQAGYKFESDDGTVSAGGALDESDEKPNSELLRVKADFRGSFGEPGDRFTFIPAARLWYDAANSEIYYSVEAAIRLHWLENKPFEFKYQKGSGAPNFNEGEQFSAGIVISF